MIKAAKIKRSWRNAGNPLAARNALITANGSENTVCENLINLKIDHNFDKIPGFWLWVLFMSSEGICLLFDFMFMAKIQKCKKNFYSNNILGSLFFFIIPCNSWVTNFFIIILYRCHYDRKKRRCKFGGQSGRMGTVFVYVLSYIYSVTYEFF